MNDTFERNDEHPALRAEETPDTDRNGRAPAPDGMTHAPGQSYSAASSQDTMEMLGSSPLSWTVDH